MNEGSAATSIGGDEPRGQDYSQHNREFQNFSREFLTRSNLEYPRFSSHEL